MEKMMTVIVFKDTTHPIELDIDERIAEIASKLFFLEIVDVVEYYLHDAYMDIYCKTNPRATSEEIAEYFSDKDRTELYKGLLSFIIRQDEVGAATEKIGFRALSD